MYKEKICKLINCKYFSYDKNFGEIGYNCRKYGTNIYEHNKFLVNCDCKILNRNIRSKIILKLFNKKNQPPLIINKKFIKELTYQLQTEIYKQLLNELLNYEKKLP